MPIARHGVLRARAQEKLDGRNMSPHYQVLVVADGAKRRLGVNVKSQSEPREVLYSLVRSDQVEPKVDVIRRSDDDESKEDRRGEPSTSAAPL